MDLLCELEKCVSELSKSGRPSTRMKEILKKLDYDRRPVLLAYQRFIKEEWAHIPDSEHINSTGDHDGSPPQSDPLPAPPKQPPPSEQIEEQMDLLNYLEACLEDHNRIGYPPIKGLEGMVKQMTPKQVAAQRRSRSSLWSSELNFHAAETAAAATMTARCRRNGRAPHTTAHNQIFPHRQWKYSIV